MVVLGAAAIKTQQEGVAPEEQEIPRLHPHHRAVTEESEAVILLSRVVVVAVLLLLAVLEHQMTQTQELHLVETAEMVLHHQLQEHL